MGMQLIIIFIICIVIALTETLIVLFDDKKNNYKSVILVKVTNETENAEQIMREILNNTDNSSMLSIIICNYDADEEKLKICKLILDNYQDYYISEPKNVKYIIEKIL